MKNEKDPFSHLRNVAGVKIDVLGRGTEIFMNLSARDGVIEEDPVAKMLNKGKERVKPITGGKIIEEGGLVGLGRKGYNRLVYLDSEDED